MVPRRKEGRLFCPPIIRHGAKAQGEGRRATGGPRGDAEARLPEGHSCVGIAVPAYCHLDRAAAARGLPRLRGVGPQLVARPLLFRRRG